MNRCLVTGAAGFIGHHLVRELLDRGWEVRALDDLSTGLRERVAPLEERDAFSFREGSVEDEATVRELTEGCDVVFHQAAVPSVPRSWAEPVRVTHANCAGSAVVLEAARRLEVGRVVIASSSSVYGDRAPDEAKQEAMPPDPKSPYALTKLWTESLARLYGENLELEAVALRYFNVFGPGQDPEGDYAAAIPKFIDRMAGGERPIVYGDGQQTRDFTYVANVVAANLAAAVDEAPTGIYNVGTGERHSVLELLGLLNELLGTDLEPLHEEPRPGEVRHSLADLTHSREVLGYEPEVDFREGLRRTVASFTDG